MTSRTFLSLSLAAALPAAAQVLPHAHSDGELIFLEDFIVTATPLARAQAELTQATGVLAGRPLLLRRQASLGDTLAGETGIHATAYAPGSSRPVLRGIGGDRVRILENGVGTADVANVSPDHAVSVEPLLIERIEVVRGPATLLHGSAAIGGVVNVIDRRIPDEAAGRPAGGAFELRHDSATGGESGVLRFDGGTGALAWTASLFRRAAGDVRIPGYAERFHDGEDEEEHEEHEEDRGRLPNSFANAEGRSVGATWFGRAARVGAAFTWFDTRYGIPPGGHEHGDEEHDHEHEEEHDEEEHGDEPVTIGLRQRRLDVKAAVTEPFALFQRADLDLAFSDYQHTEFEGDETGTRFDQRGREIRLTLPHRPFGDVSGAWGWHHQDTDLAAQGEEAFLPPTRTTNWAAFLFEEWQAAPLLFQGGARLERQRLSPDAAGLPARTFTGVSVSAGAVWAIDETWGLAAHAARNERPPNAQELYADGPHAGTGSYEIGDPSLGKEHAVSLELSLRKRRGFVTGAVNLFTQRFGNHIYERPTGAEEDGLPVFAFVQRGAEFTGWEVETWWHLHQSRAHAFDLKLATDSVRAHLRDGGGPLPRIPPRRWIAALRWDAPAWSAGLDLVHAERQDRVAPNETPSDAYTLLGADVSWQVPAGHGQWLLFVRGSNLTHAEARPHTSYLKDVAPRPGRGVTFGLRATF